MIDTESDDKYALDLNKIDMASIQDLYERIKQEEDIKELLKLCAELLDKFGYFELVEQRHVFNSCASEFLKERWPEDSKIIRITRQKIIEQINSIDENNNAEIYANLMIISNRIAHYFIENPDLKNIEKNNKVNATDIFFEIKHGCIKTLHRLRKKNKEMLLLDRIKEVLLVALPNYFEVFMVHIPEIIRDDLEEYSSCYKDMGYKFLNTNNEIVNRISFFPFYISSDKNHIMENLNHYKNSKNLGLIREKLIWYKNMMIDFEKNKEQWNGIPLPSEKDSAAILRRIKSKKTKSQDDMGNKKMKNTAKSVPRSTKKAFKKTPKKKTTERSINDNKTFWNSRKIDDIFGEQIIRFLTDVKYSHEEVYNKIMKIMRGTLKDIIDIDLNNENEMNRFYIYFTVANTTSQIATGTINGEKLDEILMNASIYYTKGWEFFEKHKNENISMRRMKQALKEYVATNGEIDILEEKQNVKEQSKERKSIKRPSKTGKTRKTRKPAESRKTRESSKSIKTNETKKEIIVQKPNEDDKVNKNSDSEITKLRNSIEKRIEALEEKRPNDNKTYLYALLDIQEEISRLEKMCDERIKEKEALKSKLSDAEEQSRKAKEEVEKAQEILKKAIAYSEKTQANERNIKDRIGEIERETDIEEISKLKDRADSFLR